jgi:hypothetical protein
MQGETRCRIAATSAVASLRIPRSALSMFAEQRVKTGGELVSMVRTCSLRRPAWSRLAAWWWFSVRKSKRPIIKAFSIFFSPTHPLG